MNKKILGVIITFLVLASLGVASTYAEKPQIYPELWELIQSNQDRISDIEDRLEIIDDHIVDLGDRVAALEAGGIGEPGLNCWDLDEDGIEDPEEDINQDGSWDTLDCQGPQGEQGPTGSQGEQGPTGPPGEQGPEGTCSCDVTQAEFDELLALYQNLLERVIILEGGCIPDCEGKVCGDDGCGGSCGTCPEGWYCDNGVCVEKLYACKEPELLDFETCMMNTGDPIGCLGVVVRSVATQLQRL
jgi:hypothetical protein